MAVILKLIFVISFVASRATATDTCVDPNPCPIHISMEKEKMEGAYVEFMTKLEEITFTGEKITARNCAVIPEVTEEYKINGVAEPAKESFWIFRAQFYEAYSCDIEVCQCGTEGQFQTCMDTVRTKQKDALTIDFPNFVKSFKKKLEDYCPPIQTV